MVVGLCLSLTVAPAVPAQQPILEVELAGVSRTLVQGRMTDEGVLELPTAPLEELTGEDLGEAEYVSLPGLDGLLGPDIGVHYDPRRAVVRIQDPLNRLVATRRLFDRRQAEVRSRPSEFLLGGPYAAATVDSEGRNLVEGGWNFGRFAVGLARSTETGLRWNASARLLERTYLTYQDADTRGQQLGVRWAGGSTFADVVWAAETGDFRARMATTVGPWTVYLQEDGTAAVSHRSDVQVTVGRTPDGFVSRVSYGRSPSPLSVPRVF